MAPLLASALVLLPFFLTGLLGDITYSYYLALAVAMVGLFGLGAFLGRISRQNVLVAGLKMIVAGVVALALSFVIESAIPG
jgi:predicted membrane protein (TIGR00267 family)